MQVHVAGAPAHTRHLGVTLRQAEPGCVSVQGEILDLRKRGLVPLGSDLQTAGVIHHMRVGGRIALGSEGPVFETLRAQQPKVAFEAGPGTGGECCRDPVRRIEALEGTRLDAAWAKRLGLAIGGPRGCSHVLTLAQLVGSAVTTALAVDESLHGPAPERPDGRRLFVRSLTIDGLETEEGNLALSLQQADVHGAPAPADAPPLARLALRREFRAVAQVDLARMALRDLRTAERVTRAGDLEGAAWSECDVAFLRGHSALGGMARTLFAGLPHAEDAPLRDVLLNLAPAVIQCIPSLERHWERFRAAHPQGGGEAGGALAGGAAAMPGGGMVDSCYMWRAGGAMSRRLAKPDPPESGTR